MNSRGESCVFFLSVNHENSLILCLYNYTPKFATAINVRINENCIYKLYLIWFLVDERIILLLLFILLSNCLERSKLRNGERSHVTISIIGWIDYIICSSVVCVSVLSVRFFTLFYRNDLIGIWPNKICFWWFFVRSCVLSWPHKTCNQIQIVSSIIFQQRWNSVQ